MKENRNEKQIELRAEKNQWGATNAFGKAKQIVFMRTHVEEADEKTSQFVVVECIMLFKFNCYFRPEHTGARDK